MRKDRYEISLWEDYIVDSTYIQVSNINREKSYHYKSIVDEKEVYSLSITGKTITLCQGFPTNFYTLTNNQYVAVPEGTSFPSVNDTTLYYYQRSGEWRSRTGSQITLYGQTIQEWYEIDIPEHYEERKIGVIGSNNMSALWRAREPKLVENINGTSTFTFKMFYRYIDTISGETVDNPMLQLLVNERKVKVLWKNKWYDLVIKSRQEDSNNKSVTFTCKDLFINELSKTGFELEFSNELMNNQGTIDELGSQVLEGTDWQLGTSDLIRQKTEEPVYEISGAMIRGTIVATDIEGNSYEITNANQILVFYSIFQDKSEFFQFLYSDTNQFSKDSSSMLVTNGKILTASATWSKNGLIATIGTGTITFSEEILVSTNYRAERYVRQQLQIFDNLTKEYVYLYKLTGENNNTKDVYGYTDTVYEDATVVVNLLSNNGYDGFSDTSGWTSQLDGEGNPIAMPFGIYPEYTTLEEAEDFTIKSKGFMFLKRGKRYLNSGIKSSLQYLTDEGFQSGAKYIFRYQVSLDDGGKPTIRNNEVIYDETDAQMNIVLWPKLGIYDENTYDMVEDGAYFTRLKGSPSVVKERDEDGTERTWIEVPFTCTKTITKEDIITTPRFGFVIEAQADCWIREVQFFQKKFGQNSEGQTVRMNPNEINTQSVVQVKYKYYNAQNNFSKIEDIEYLYCDFEPWDNDNLVPVYATTTIEVDGEERTVESFEKIRSIEQKQSNRFNILQELAETFECYPKFTILHDEDTGRIEYINGLPQKFVSFHEEIGQRTGLSFVYGIDLKTVSRTVNSDQIVTKTIVTPNSNEYAKNGFCTIQRASNNPSKSSFILNLDYYISHGLIDGAQFMSDLYDTSPPNIGYYAKLRELNTEYDALTEKYSVKKTELEKYESRLKVYQTYVTEGQEEITQIVTDLGTLAGLTKVTIKAVNNYLENEPGNTDVQTLKLAWGNTKNAISNYKKQIEQLTNKKETGQIDLLKKVVDQYDERREELREQIKELDLQFYNKYSRFIQEGTWTSEEYIDDELYFYDAQSVSYTSSRPQVQYNISVLRLSALEEFRYKIFNLGDICYIQDTEFFGYQMIDNVKTPYKEEVLISEITSNFESPENDSFKVQNYKTQFEDLFQRITAATQSLQYAKGEYQKAANIVESDGTSIKASILQNTLALNQNIMISSQNNAFTQDSTGLTVTDVSNPNKKVKITSGGILFTNDGVNWKTGIDAAGMRADYLTTGSINTNNITVFSGKYPTFRWTSTGLDAYSFTDNGVDFGDFVRFDQYGIYGILNNQDFLPENEDNIWDTAKFGMTWKGFFMKNKEGEGWVEISSENDLAIFKEDIEEPKIKIGRLGKSLVDGIEKTIYGIKIADDDGVSVLETNDSGQLWLKDKLRVETYNNNEVQIGKLDEKKYEEIGIGEIEDFEEGIIYYEQVIEYIQTTDIEYNSEKIYYVLNEDNIYEQVNITEFEEGITYYEQVIEYIQTTDETFNPNKIYYVLPISRIIDANNTFVVYEDGSIRATNGIFSGQLSAATGSFSGELVAATGSFSGQISASSGNIGNVVINDNDQNLVVTNGGLVIQNVLYEQANIIEFEEGITYYEQIVEYIQTEDTEYNSEKIYYILNENNKYEQVNITEFEEGITYYEQVIEYIQTTDETFNPNKIYYVLNEDNIYEQVNITEFEEGTTYYESIETGEYEQTSDTIFNPNKIYYTQLKENLFYYNEEDKCLTIAGDTVFSGALEGASGNFSGEITAQSGSIGGFLIEDGFLVSSDKTSIKLDGTNGKIVANNIELGTGAEISEYIKLGDAYIRNPKLSNNHLFIEAGAIKIYDNGMINFGAINIDGTNSKIFGTNFSITPDKAIFSNVDVTGTIHTSVFEIGTIQSVGGSMLFEHAAKIETVDDKNETYTITTGADGAKFNVDDYVYLTGNNYKHKTKIISKDSESNEGESFTFTVESLGDFDPDTKKIDVMTFLANFGTDASKADNLIIGVNSSHVQDDFLLPRGFSFLEAVCEYEYEQANITKFEAGITYYEFNEETGEYVQTTDTTFNPNKIYYTYKQFINPSISETPTLFLGNLKSIKFDNTTTTLSGYGLYGENVYLNGTLTTKVDAESYAGINTISGVKATVFKKYEVADESRIVFWGGAISRSNGAIQEANFQVTENGSIYANSGIFEGTIISKSTIEGSILRAAKIYGPSAGFENDSTPALQIYNTNENYGIEFREEDGNNDYKTLSLFAQGFTAYASDEETQKSFITFNRYVKTEDTEYNSEKIYYVLNEDNIYEQANIIEFEEGTTYYEDSIEVNADFNCVSTPNLKNENMTLSLSRDTYSFKTETDDIQNYSGQFINFYKDVKIQNQKSIFYNEKMEYRYTENGYDLYIS